MDELQKKRHSLSHLLAAAVLKVKPDTKTAIGPATKTGFYYDFEFTEPIKDTDLQKIEKQMKKILPNWKEFNGEEISADKAKELFKDNPYKLELINELVENGEKITIYISGNFTDLCKGGHIDQMNKIDPDSFKLDKIAGAYWRGDENKKMLTRIYGLAFNNKDELNDFLEKKEEAEKRDHRKLGKQLDLFTFSDNVGAGLPLFTPKGTILRNQLQEHLLKISEKYGMEPVTIPHIAKKKLYDLSGHSEKFADELIKVESQYEQFIMKPANCPHHTQIYDSRPRSYRDLPVRYMESTMQYRDEKPGELTGLSRVRAITVDDGHIFCTPQQLKTEVKNIAEIIKTFYTDLGLWGDHWVSLSIRDPQKPEKYIGSEDGWNKAEKTLEEISDELQLQAKSVEGEAAIYGPKLDYMFKDSLGREQQLATIQIDFSMPKRFGLEYTDKDGGKKTPIMIHRAILGSYERFLAVLIEHFGGHFPFWLAPTQVAVLPINTDAHGDTAEKIKQKMKEANIRIKLFDGNESLGKKIKTVREEKIPYTIVVGDNEIQSQEFSAEKSNGGKLKPMSEDELIKTLRKEIEDKK